MLDGILRRIGLGYTAGEIDIKLYTAVSVMISKCANPNCSKTLMRLDGGRFYGFPTGQKTIEHFWLCGSCSKSFILRLVEGRVKLQSRDQKAA